MKVNIEEHDAQMDAKVHDKLHKQLLSEIEYLRNLNEQLMQQNDHMSQLVGLSQKNIERLTQQIEAKDFLLEDMREQSWWDKLWRRKRFTSVKSSSSPT